MDDPTQAGSDALRWLDANVVAAADAPDEAFDWVFMLRPDDWPLLESIWPKRSSEWRAAFAYTLCDGTVPPAQRILRLALADANADVALEAAGSLCWQFLRYPDQAPFDPSLVPRLQELKRLHGPGKWTEVDEVLRLHGWAL
jgi:hypothetical protein